MATFTQNGADQFGEDLTFTPNYGLLQTALTQSQGQYDQGYASLRNRKDNLMNSELTNAENRKFRNTEYTKISKDMQRLASTDLSKAENVKAGVSLFDPIVKDQELMHDIAITKHARSEMARAKAAVNSIDPEVRKRYNQESVELMGLRLTDLSNAKRGKGEIQNVRPENYVPKENIPSYLSKAATEQELEIIGTEQSGMYLVKTKNGQAAEVPFTEWAQAQISGAFDAQFRVSSELRTEKSIRGLMAEEGITRDDAQRQLGNELKTSIIEAGERGARDVQASKERLIQRKSQHEAIPESDRTQQEQMDLQDIEDQLTQVGKYQKNQNENLEDLKTKEADFFGQNLAHYTKEQIKSNTTSSWARNYSTLTSERTVTEDKVKMTMFKEDQSNARLMVNIRHKEDAATTKYNHQNALASAKHQWDVDLEGVKAGHALNKLQVETGLKAQYAVDSKTGKLKAPEVQDVGAYHNANQELTAYSLYNSDQNRQVTDIISSAVTHDGLVAQVFESLPEKQNEYTQFFEIIQNVIGAEGVPANVSDEQVAVLESVLKENGILMDYKGHGFGTVKKTGKKFWQDMAMNVTGKLSTRFTDMPNDETSNKYQSTLKRAELDSKFGSQYGTYLKNNEQMQTAITGLFGEGAILEGEEITDHFNVIEVGDKKTYFPKDDAEESIGVALSNVTPDEYKAQLKQTGRMYMVSDAQPGIFETIRNAADITSVKSVEKNGSTNEVEIEDFSKDKEFMGLNATSLAKRYGDNYTADIDPATKTVTYHFKPTGEKEPGGEDAITKGYQITMPFSSAKQMTPALGDKIARYEDDVTNLGTLGRDALKYVFTPGEAKKNIVPPYYLSAGIDFNITRSSEAFDGPNGQTKYKDIILITGRTQDPLTKVWSLEKPARIDVTGRNNIEKASEVEKLIHTIGQGKLRAKSQIIQDERKRVKLEKARDLALAEAKMKEQQS
jgi:hypothetical protein